MGSLRSFLSVKLEMAFVVFNEDLLEIFFGIVRLS